MITCKIKQCEIYRDNKYCHSNKACEDCRHLKNACKIFGGNCPIASFCPNKEPQQSIDEFVKQQMKGDGENA